MLKHAALKNLHTALLFEPNIDEQILNQNANKKQPYNY